MISEQKRQQNLATAKKVLKDTHLKVLGYNLDGEGANGIFTQCTFCNKVSKRSLNYWIKYPNCYCQRAINIARSQRLPKEEVEALLKRGNVKALSEYKGLNHKMKVECLGCGHRWAAWATNLSRSKSCFHCGQEKLRRNNLEKYGVESSIQRSDVIAKRRATMMDKYGVEHALQDKGLFEKNLRSSFKLKKFQLGKRTVEVQGYEDQALVYVLSKGVRPRDIECGSGSAVPSVPYVWKGKARIYHPDIYVKSLNRIFEVKSKYTYTRGLKLNLAKKAACEAAGYKFTFLIMDGHGNRIKP